MFSSTGLQYWRAELLARLNHWGKFYRKLHQLVNCSLPSFTKCWDIDTIYLGNTEITLSTMLKYLWNRGQNPTSEREKLQKELFSFSKNVEYGFPNKPLSMDYDPHLHLLVIITKSGLIRIFGQPGVELSGHLANKELGLVKVLFLPGQGRLITLAGPGNVLHFWEIEDNKIEKVRSEFTNDSSIISLKNSPIALDKDNPPGLCQVGDLHTHNSQ